MTRRAPHGKAPGTSCRGARSCRAGIGARACADG